jgi:hypothetical protein
MDQLSIRSGEPVAQLLRAERPAVEVDRCGAIADNQAGSDCAQVPGGRRHRINPRCVHRISYEAFAERLRSAPGSKVNAGKQRWMRGLAGLFLWSADGRCQPLSPARRLKRARLNFLVAR